MHKILVIDDNIAVRTTIVQMLEAEGYEVVSAEDGRRGLAVFRSAKPDLVVTDIIMPEKEGIETIRDIRDLSPKANHRDLGRRANRQYRFPDDRARSRRVRGHCQAARSR